MKIDKSIEQLIGIAALFLLAVGCFVVLRPFLSALLWAAILCFSTWPLYSRLERRLDGRRHLAAALMTLAVAVVLLVPLAVVVATLAENVARLATAIRATLVHGVPPLPAWIVGLPLVGGRIADYWQGLSQDSGQLALELRKLIGPATDLALSSGAALGAGTLELALSVFIAFFFYRSGRHVANRLTSSVERLAGSRAQRLLGVAAATVKGVVYGIIGTALAQGGLAALGFWIAGVPGPLFLGFLTFVLSLVPMGLLFAWIPVVVWVFAQGEVGWGIFLSVWAALVVSGVDNLLRPYLISKGSNLPLILVFLGALGGVFTFGFIGIFLGPILLAVGFNLLNEWNSTAALLALEGVDRGRHRTQAMTPEKRREG